MSSAAQAQSQAPGVVPPQRRTIFAIASAKASHDANAQVLPSCQVLLAEIVPTPQDLSLGSRSPANARIFLIVEFGQSRISFESRLFYSVGSMPWMGA